LLAAPALSPAPGPQKSKLKKAHFAIAYRKNCCQTSLDYFVVGNRGLTMTTRFLAFVIATSVSACGTYTPDKDPFQSDAPSQNYVSSQGAYETAIVIHVACEIGQGLEEAEKLQLPWLEEQWGTTVSQTITVEDQTGLSPGISAITPFQNGLFPFPASSGGNVVVVSIVFL
jgi:hypothetical protein